MDRLNLPKNMAFLDHGSHVEFVRTWRGWTTLFFVCFTGFWWFALSKFFEKMPNLGDSLFAYIPYIHVTAGIFLIYYTIASFFNKTYIFADNSKIEVRHRPIPWLGNRKMDATDIEQLYVKEVISRNRNGSSTSYQLRAKNRSGGEIKMLSGLQNSDQAIFVEEKLEALLNIKNRRVRGEY